ncbi:MAG TPA: hypothetical protein VGN00_05650 [Puia sp.]|jgi:hypothetical protein
MKLSIQLTIGVILAAFLAGSCRKDNLFKGRDNDIASFQLKAGDNYLKSYIQNDSIVVTAPGNLSLAGATAVIVLSERATISPDPSTVTDWTQPQSFVVTSYDGAKRTFQYVLQRNVISKDGDIILMTQADVDTLAKMGLTRISGNLTIGRPGGIDSISSLAGLSSITSIALSLTINPTYTGKDLKGLDNLQTIGSFLIGPAITANNQGTQGPLMNLKTISLPKLTEVMANIIINGPGITTLDLPALTKVDLGIEIDYLDSLTTFQLPKLQSVLQSITLQGYFLPNSLQTINLPALTSVGGDVTVTSWSNLTTVSLPVLTKTSSLIITGEVSLTAIMAPKLQTAFGNVDFSYNSLLTTIDVSALQTIGGSFALGGASSLVDLSGFKSLSSVGSDLALTDLSSLTDLSGLSALKTIGGDVQILNVPFKNFSGFAATKLKSVTIDGTGITTIQQIDLSGIDITTFVKISGVTGGVAVKGKDVLNGDLTVESSDVVLSGFKQVNNFTFSYHDFDPAPSAPTSTLPMQKVNGDLNITINGYHTLSLPNLASIAGMCLISTGYDIYSLTDIQAPVLTKIGGQLFITGTNGSSPNTLMTNLSGFSSLTSVQSVTIINSQALTDFTGLKNAIPSIPAANWSVSGNLYNPSYLDMLDGKYVM